jgi:hypothetical protein
MFALDAAFYTAVLVSPLSAGQIALWHALVHIANKCRWQEEFSVANSTLCLLTGLSPSAVKNARTVLKQRGMIAYRSNSTKAAIYTLTIIRSDQVTSQETGQVSGQVKPKRSKASGPKQAEASPKANDKFDTFWAAYPRKIGKDAARKAFAKRNVTKELLQQMLDAIEAQKRSEQWQKNGGQFIPHPATWINQGRWQDETEQLPFADEPAGNYVGEIYYD